MLIKRIITAVVLAPIMIGGIFFLPLHQFALFIGLIVVLGGWEWANFAGWSNIPQRAMYVAVLIALLLLVYTTKDSLAWLMDFILWISFAWWILSVAIIRKFPNIPKFIFNPMSQLFIGVLVIIPMWVGLYKLRMNPDATLWIVYLMFIVWGADVGAYFLGKAIGKHKLAPNVSPAKSWEGVLGGTITVCLVAVIAGTYFTYYGDFGVQNWIMLFVISVVVMAVSILGDLVESMFKRNRGIKDSSNILPGHGGVMDRADSLTAAVPVFALLLAYI